MGERETRKGKERKEGKGRLPSHLDSLFLPQLTLGAYQAFQSHDPKTGDVIRTTADDDQLSLSDLVRQERFAGGSSSQKDMDYDVANRIATDAKFNTDLDYQDENAERLARRKMKSESMKRQFAINGKYDSVKSGVEYALISSASSSLQIMLERKRLSTRKFPSLIARVTSWS